MARMKSILSGGGGMGLGKAPGEELEGPESEGAEELEGGASLEALEAAGDIFDAFEAGDRGAFVRALGRILDAEGYGASLPDPAAADDWGLASARRR